MSDLPTMARLQRKMKASGVNRRRLLQGAGALSLASVVAPASRRAAFAQGTPAANVTPWEPRFTDEGTIHRFGFGTDNITSEVRVAAFEQTYPNISLEVTEQVDDQKILTAVASGDVPDLFWLASDSIQSWAARGALEPLDDLIAGDDRFDVSQFYQSEVTRDQYDGQTWGIPQFVDCRPLWLDAAPLQEVGIDIAAVDAANWQQLQDNGVALLAKNGDEITRWGFDPKSDGFFWMWSWGNGGNLLSEDGRTATFDMQENIDALQFNVDTYDVQGGFAAYQAFIQTTGFDGADNFFVQGEVPTTLFESWLLGIVAGGDPDHQFAVTPFKGKDGQVYSITGGNSWAIPKGAKNKEAAWEWISYFSSPAIWVETSQTIKQRRQENQELYTPALTASQTANQLLMEQVFEPTENDSVNQAIGLFPTLLGANRQAAASPVLKEINDILSNTVIKPALNGEKSPADALKDGQEKAQGALDDFFS
jgi:multiple sugar transport system substrate-binding protein